MERHERHCTANPERACGFCDLIGESPAPIDELKATIADIIGERSWIEVGNQNDELIQQLREAVNGCPGCMLATLRQSPDSMPLPHFDFQQERDAFLATVERD